MSEEVPKVEAPPVEAPQVEAPPADAPKSPPAEAVPVEPPKQEAPPANTAPIQAPKVELAPVIDTEKFNSQTPEKTPKLNASPSAASGKVAISTSRLSNSQFGDKTMALLKDENLTVAEREALAEAKRAQRMAKRRMAELEEEHRAFIEEKKITDEIARKEKILEMSRSRSRDRSAQKPANALNQPVSKVELKNFKPESPKQPVQSPKIHEIVNQAYYKPQYEKGNLASFLKSESNETPAGYTAAAPAYQPKVVIVEEINIPEVQAPIQNQALKQEPITIEQVQQVQQESMPQQVKQEPIKQTQQVQYQTQQEPQQQTQQQTYQEPIQQTRQQYQEPIQDTRQVQRQIFQEVQQQYQIPPMNPYLEEYGGQLQTSQETPYLLNQRSDVFPDPLEGTFQPHEIEQNRQKVLSDDLLSKFQLDQQQFKTRNLKEIEQEFNNHFVRVYSKGSHSSGLQGCQSLILEHSDSPEVATVFLRTLQDKNIVLMEGAARIPFMVAHIQIIGLLAKSFRFNMLETIKDKEPSVAKTVRRLVVAMKELFFSETHDSIRHEIAETLSIILEKCFVNKRYGYENKKAKDLIFQPLFDELQKPKERISRQTTCIVLKKLNEKYMQDPDIVNILHSHTMTALGIKHKIYDGEFLMAIVDLLNEHGIAITLGECLIKAINHFISSIKYNLTGQNSSSKMHRDQHLCASITILTVFANCCIATEFGPQIVPKYLLPLNEALMALNGESQPIQRLKQQCQMAWKKLEIHGQAQQQIEIQMVEKQMHNQRQQFEQQYGGYEQQFMGSNETPDFVDTQQQYQHQFIDQQPQYEQEPLMNIQEYEQPQPPQQQFNQSSFGELPNKQLTNQLNDIQQNIDKSLQMIQKKMNNIEQKVFATQKNMDAIEKIPEPVVPSQKKPTQEQETLKMMLETLQKQQEQINQFMKNTQVDLKQMETQIVQQNSVATKLKEQNIPQTPLMINELAQALYEKQQEEKLKESILKLDRKLDASAEKENLNFNQAPPQTQFFNARLSRGGNPINQLYHAQNTRAQKPQELTFIEKKVLKAEKMSAIWLQISKLAFEQDYQNAYDIALTQSDDIYLLRLIVQTGPVLTRGLTDSTAKKVLMRLNRIVRGGIFYKIQIDWLDDARKGEIFRNLSHQEQNEYLDTLFQFANPRSDLVKHELKERAAEVYRIAKNQAKNGY